MDVAISPAVNNLTLYNAHGCKSVSCHVGPVLHIHTHHAVFIGEAPCAEPGQLADFMRFQAYGGTPAAVRA